MRVVADTNVLISALLFDGLPGILLAHATKREFILATSRELFDELEEKPLGKFAFDPRDTALFLKK